MEGGGASNGDSLSVFASIASVLGVQGPLRFRPHGASQKAHVVLRRVIVSDDSSDNGSGRHVVRFSLYAQKRIEVKPGKEILLTVAEGVFKDQAIVLEAELTDPGDVADGKPAVEVAEEDEAPVLPPVIPPKMRRAWTRRGEEPNVIIPPPVRTSIGIQAQPSYSSVQTQCQPEHSVHATQTSSVTVSRAVQVNPPPLPPAKIRLSSSVQTGDAIRYTSSVVQTDLSDEPKEKSPAEVVEDHDSFHKELVRERSLSPMELDSVSGSPDVSPNSTPKTIRSQLERFATPPRSPTSSIASSSGFQDVPVDPPLYVNGVKGAEPRTKYEGSMSSDSSTSAPGKPEMGARTITSSLNQSVNGKADPKKPVYNNFVPAKHATGPSASMEGNAPATTEILTTTQKFVSALLQQVLPSGNTSKFNSSDKSPAVGKTNLLMQNAFASTSRNTPNQVDVLANNKHSLPNSSKLSPTLSTRAHQKSPVLAMKQIPTPGPSNGSSLTISSNDPYLSPPPAPKALAYIPVGPSSNPLGIKPSIKPSTFRPLKHDPPIGPKALTQATKKRVVVGTGWSAARGATSLNNGTLSASIPSSSSISLPSPAPPQAASAYINHAKAVDLSHIVSYSPSPPPLPPPPSPAPPSATPTTKWKRVNEDSFGQKSDSPGCGPPPLRTSSLSTQPSFVSASQSPLTPSTPPESPYLTCPIPALSSSKKKYLIGQDIQGKSPLLDPLPSIASAPLRAEQSPVVDSTASTPSPISATAQAGKARPSISLSSPARLSLYNSQRVNSIPFGSPSGSITPSGPSTPSIPPALVHPLPPRPIQACPTLRGIKRERPPSPELIPEGGRQRRRRTFRWPTVDSSHAVKLEGEGTVAIRTLAFSSDGEHFALSCDDRTVRIWNNRTRVEVARLSHNSSVIAALWMDGDEGVIALSEDGLVSKWTRDGPNKWKWAKMVHAGLDNRLDEEPLCLAYARDRIAVSFPRLGVKVWFWLKGTWQPQRSILRPSVSAIRFVEDGEAIVGGTREGVLWYSQIPNGTLRAYAFLKSKINSIDVTPTGSHIIIGHSTGAARLVAIRQADNKGSIEQSYSSADTERNVAGFGAIFATKGQAILFGSVDGCVLVWDRKKGTVVYGLEHEEGDVIQAVASFDGRTSKDGCLVTGTKFGQISWWAQPVAAPTPDDSQKAKRAKKA